MINIFGKVGKLLILLMTFKPQLDMIMKGNSLQSPFNNRKDLAKWCADNQPYYKKVIPEVVEHFCVIYNIN